MLCDCLTKGGVDRERLLTAWRTGEWVIEGDAPKMWTFRSRTTAYKPKYGAVSRDANHAFAHEEVADWFMDMFVRMLLAGTNLEANLADREHDAAAEDDCVKSPVSSPESLESVSAVVRFRGPSPDTLSRGVGYAVFTATSPQHESSEQERLPFRRRYGTAAASSQSNEEFWEMQYEVSSQEHLRCNRCGLITDPPHWGNECPTNPRLQSRQPKKGELPPWRKDQQKSSQGVSGKRAPWHDGMRARVEREAEGVRSDSVCGMWAQRHDGMRARKRTAEASSIANDREQKKNRH